MLERRHTHAAWEEMLSPLDTRMTAAEVAAAEAFHACNQMSQFIDALNAQEARLGRLISDIADLIARTERLRQRVERVDGRCERIERYILSHDPNYHRAITTGGRVHVDLDEAPVLEAGREVR